MPVMNGWEFLEAIQTSSYRDKVLVVMVTSSINNSDKKNASHYSQVIDYLVKPLSVESCRQLKQLPQIHHLM